MYIINKQTAKIITVSNPNEIYKNELGEDTVYTNLQYAWLSIAQSQRVNYFEQESLPNCESKYFKVANNQLVEMSLEDKTIIEAETYLKNKIMELDWLHPERTYRLTIPKTMVKTGGILENYKNDLLVEKVPYYPDKDMNGNIIVYLEEIAEEAINILNSLQINIEIL